ncbi:hypothetical protein ACWEQP_02880 [Streptomyces sp. NPDC004044]
MRVTSAAATVIALGVLLGGFTASAAADAPGTARQRTVASAPSSTGPVSGPLDDHGNG